MTSQTVPFYKRRLRRSTGDRWLGGVLGGVAETYNWNPALLRLAVVFGVLVPGLQVLILLYLAAWFIMPDSR